MASADPIRYLISYRRRRHDARALGRGDSAAPIEGLIINQSRRHHVIRGLSNLTTISLLSQYVSMIVLKDPRRWCVLDARTRSGATRSCRVTTLGAEEVLFAPNNDQVLMQLLHVCRELLDIKLLCLVSQGSLRKGRCGPCFLMITPHRGQHSSHRPRSQALRASSNLKECPESQIDTSYDGRDISVFVAAIACMFYHTLPIN